MKVVGDSKLRAPMGQVSDMDLRSEGLQDRRRLWRHDGRRARAEYRRLDRQPTYQGPGDAPWPAAVPAWSIRLRADRGRPKGLRRGLAAAGVGRFVSQQHRRHPPQDGREPRDRHVRQDRDQSECSSRRCNCALFGARTGRDAQHACGLDQSYRAGNPRRHLSGRHRPELP